MSTIDLVWYLWGGLALLFVAVLMYRAQLSRYDEEQLFLDDASSRQHEQQDEIIRKVKRIDPMVRIIGGAVGTVTAGILGFYVWDAIKHLS